MPNNKSKVINRAAKSIFVANVKGGVGKSTLSIMLARSLAEKIPPQNITVIDTDLQRTATEFLSKSNPEINVEFIPITPAFEHTNISLVQQFIKQNEFRPGHVAIVDTPAGSSQRLWNLVAEGYGILMWNFSYNSVCWSNCGNYPDSSSSLFSMGNFVRILVCIDCTYCHPNS